MSFQSSGSPVFGAKPLGRAEVFVDIAFVVGARELLRLPGHCFGWRACRMSTHFIHWPPFHCEIGGSLAAHVADENPREGRLNVDPVRSPQPLTMVA
jgi:hypothetical protein